MPPTPTESDDEQRILLLAPIGQDAALMSHALGLAGMQSMICQSSDGLLHQMQRGAGALLLTEESGILADSELEIMLRKQAPWSDIPILVLTVREEGPKSADTKILAALAIGGNITLLERPLRSVTLISAVQSALRARRRQYHVRELLKEREQEREKLALKVRELAQSNEELEQFAFIAAHDLQEPIRMIGSYLSLIERDKDSHFSPRTKGFFDFVTSSSTRMKAMIQAVLDYSRIGKEDTEFFPVDCSQALTQATEILSGVILKNKATISAQPLPRVWGSAAQITRLFQNLISNSIKFKSSANPVISVSAVRTDGQWTISLTDNGIGIDPENGKRLFGIFQRLHGSDQYPGTGIGLAACKKIVEQHHGRIWFDSEPGRGSTFHFTLTASDDAPASASRSAVLAPVSP